MYIDNNDEVGSVELPSNAPDDVRHEMNVFLREKKNEQIFSEHYLHIYIYSFSYEIAFILIYCR